METFKAICLPLAVVLMLVAFILPPRTTGNATANAVRLTLWIASLALAVIALFVTIDAIS